MLVDCFIPPKNELFPLKSVQNFAENFLLFWLFVVKNIKIAYFDQRLECAAPNRWSKYTTTVIYSNLICKRHSVLKYSYDSNSVLVRHFGQKLSLVLKWSLVHLLDQLTLNR